MRNLAYYKGCVLDLQAWLAKETDTEARQDIRNAIKFAKARVRLIERRAGIRNLNFERKCHE
jgi:hypothetical protein